MAADTVDTQVAGECSRATTSAEAAAAIAGLSRSERYHVTGTLASGGMGEVLLADDIPLAREVVLKRMRTAAPSPESIARFLREARIQGRLQHPSIVPVHDLAIDSSGRPFFAMKALVARDGSGVAPGETLASVLDPNRRSMRSRAELLRAFIDVCLAIELAHTRGVIHRDLKPANIALGDFGEVYVLDWGVARIVGDDHPDALDAVDWPLAGGSSPTLPGAILGTPGYMSPEQLRADPEVGPASDIYALGCILFEILTGEPLHPRSGPMASTAMGADARPSHRVPGRGVSPELDAICVRATQPESAARFATARALADAVQRYLDGDRDLVRRRELAVEQLREARTALARAEAAPASGSVTRGALATDDSRREAVRAAGHALALDPECAEAAEIVSHLLIAAPSAMPGDLHDDLEAKLADEGRAHTRLGTIGLLAYALYLPVFLWIGVRDWTWFAVTCAIVAASAGFTWFSFRMRRPAAWRAWVTMGASALLVAMFARLIGPFVLPAGMATVSMAVSATNPHLARRGRLVVLAFLVAALAPWGLELAGVLAPSYTTDAGGFHLLSPALAINPGPGEIAIAGYVIAVIVVMGALSLRVARANLDSRARLELQAWHLRQLVPTARASRSSVQ